MLLLHNLAVRGSSPYTYHGVVPCNLDYFPPHGSSELYNLCMNYTGRTTTLQKTAGVCGSLITIISTLHLPHACCCEIQTSSLSRIEQLALSVYKPGAFSSNKGANDFGTLLHHHLNLSCLVTLASS